MVQFNTDNVRFVLRVAGIALHDGHVLLQHDVDEWFAPGGRCELLEPSRDSLQREMREELWVDVEVVRLLWVFENFYVRWKQKHHEITFSFLMTIQDDAFLQHKSETILRPEKEWVLRFAWVHLEHLDQFNIFPPVLRQCLRQLPQGVEHVIYRAPQVTEP